MKLESAQLEVTRSNAFKEKVFTIESNAKAFDILSSKLYSDIPLAIVRELSTNAHDAHVDAGTVDKPFLVHLPNSLEPFFSIRDYGTGLCQKDVEEIYTTYFRSTRNKSDKFVGCLGLGSKSPFAYSDNFLVTSYLDGTKYVYSMFKNEEGSPTVALLNESNTGEPNGLEIKITIKKDDFFEFINAATKIYPHFNLHPTVVGAKIQQLEEPLVIGDDYKLYHNQNQYGPSIIAVMGQVGYEVDLFAITNDIGNQCTLVINVDIGSCSIAASREALHYDAKTTKTLLDKVNLATSHAKIQIENKSNNAPCLLEKKKEASKYYQLFKYGSFDLNIRCDILNKYVCSEIHLYENRLTIYRSNYQINVSNNNNYVFIEEDCDINVRKNKAKLRHFIKENKINNACYYLCKIQDDVEFKQIFGDITAKLSMLPDPPRKIAATTPNRSKPVFIKELAGEIWTNPTASINAGSYAVKRDGNSVIWDKKNVRAREIKEIALILDLEVVYGVTESRYETLCKKFNLVDLETHVKQIAEDKVKNLTEKEIYYLQDYHKLLNINSDLFGKLKNNKNLKNASKELCDFHNSLNISLNYNNFCRLLSHFELKLPKTPNFRELFFKKYPILLDIDDSGANIDRVVEYINLIDRVAV